MASSRRTGTGENVSTYDSGGGQDYSSLVTWESDTDNDLVSTTTSEVLECYTGLHTENAVTFSGATTNTSYFRIIRPASGEGHSGIPKADGTIVCFNQPSPTTWIGWGCYEANFHFQDFAIRSSCNTSNWQVCFNVTQDNVCFICVMAFDCQNAGTGNVAAFFLNSASSPKAINCLAHNCERSGFVGNTGSPYFYNCTSTNNMYGFYQAAGTPTARNCCASGNTTLDWQGTWSQTTCTAEDATPTYVDSANDDFHLASNDTVCINNGTDLSGDANYAFDDDIDFQTRTGSWDIGMDEYFVSGPPKFIIEQLAFKPFDGIR